MFIVLPQTEQISVANAIMLIAYKYYVDNPGTSVKDSVEAARDFYKEAWPSIDVSL